MTHLLQEEIGRIWSLIPSRYVGQNGLMVYAVDPVSGAITDSRAAVQDFGDYVQYAYACAEILKRPELSEWAIDQVIKGCGAYQTKSGFLIPGASTAAAVARQRSISYFRSEDNTDMFMGISSLYSLSRRQELLPFIEGFFSFLRKENPDSRLHGNVYLTVPFAQLRLPFRLPDGLYAEDLARLSAALQRPEMEKIAENIMAQWTHSSYHRNTGLFPIAANTIPLPRVLFEGRLASQLDRMRTRGTRHSTGWKLTSSFLIKTNTNMISAALELYQLTGELRWREMTERWLDFVAQNMQRGDGYFYGTWDGRKSAPIHGSWPLADNHHIANIFLDASVRLNDSCWLQPVLKNFEFWRQQVGTTGLIPELYRPGHERSAMLDMQVDYFIVALKLAERTGDHTIRSWCDDRIRSLVSSFRAPYGVHWRVDVDTGQPLSTKICTKFLALYTKLLLLYLAALEEKKIYADENLFNLSRDR